MNKDKIFFTILFGLLILNRSFTMKKKFLKKEHQVKSIDNILGKKFGVNDNHHIPVCMQASKKYTKKTNQEAKKQDYFRRNNNNFKK